jgi:hypothetical protein
MRAIVDNYTETSAKFIGSALNQPSVLCIVLWHVYTSVLSNGYERCEMGFVLGASLLLVAELIAYRFDLLAEYVGIQWRHPYPSARGPTDQALLSNST